MPTPLTDTNAIYKAISEHLRTGIPIDPQYFGLTQDQTDRIRVATELYHLWQQNPLIPARSWLEQIKHRTHNQVANDLRVFEFIKKAKADQAVLSDTDARATADHYIKKLLRAGDQTGDMHFITEGLKQLGKWHNPDKADEQIAADALAASQPVVFTSRVVDIAPDYVDVTDQYLDDIRERYNGAQDNNVSEVEREKQALLARYKQ